MAEDRLKEICENCGLTFGAHCGVAYYSRQYKRNIPDNCCPGHQGRMNWDKGPGTTFAPTGKYEDVPNGTVAKEIR